MATTTSFRRAHVSFGYLLRSPARFIAFGFGLGLAPRAPGTLASLAAIPVYNVLAARMATVDLLLLAGLAFFAGVWACEQAGRDIGMEDHGGMVWDEMVAMLFTLSFLPGTFIAQGAAFVLFRYFDIAKPGPVGYAQLKIRGGLGVMADDLVAAFCVLLCFTLWKLILG
ncbi:MAG: phosphatidylglycerophosphatase A [Betaproteobacteria bacterium]|nr:phosphatidylglycerophosphatase A [Betaproteobacteria bacterium]